MKARTLNKSELIKIYDNAYIEKQEVSNKKRLIRLIKYMNLADNQVVLDVGCGSGRLVDIISEKVQEYYGVDFVKGFIKAANEKKKKNNIKNAKFYCGDVSKFCIDYPNYFNKIFCLDFTEHIFDETFKEIFRSLYKSLRKDGEIFIHTPNGDYLLELLKNKKILKQRPEHIAVRNGYAYITLLKSLGYKNIKIKYLSHYLKLLSLIDFLRYIPFLGKYFKARLLIICKK